MRVYVSVGGKKPKRFDSLKIKRFHLGIRINMKKVCKNNLERYLVNIFEDKITEESATQEKQFGLIPHINPCVGRITTYTSCCVMSEKCVIR